MNQPLVRLRAYITFLSIVLAVLIYSAISNGLTLGENRVAWVVLAALFFASEYGDIYFHDASARLAVSPSEAILLPMLVILSMDQILIGVVIAIALERMLRKVGLLKALFNVASFGCAAAASAAFWGTVRDPSEGLSIFNGLAVTTAILLFALLTHLFTSVAIALAEGRSVTELTKAIGRTTLVNLAGGVLLGLLFAASFLAAPWTIILCPFALLALYLGNRAMAAQSGEKERVEHLHAATRALVGGPELPDALTNFLGEVNKIASSSEARAILDLDDQLVWSAVRLDKCTAKMTPLTDPAMEALFSHLKALPEPVIVGGDEAGANADLGRGFGASSFVAVPIEKDATVIGCLLVLDRLGADEFKVSDGRLLQALGNELVVSLDSYRLFAEVAEERERFGRIFSGSKEGICLLDSDGTVRAWNPALERMTGHLAADLMGRIWSEAVVIRDRGEARLTGDELVGVEPDEELEVVTKTGPSRWITTIAGPVGESEGGGWVVLVRDVTAEHEIEAAKSDFLSTISHELRTPLTTIKGSLQVLGRGRDALPPDLAEQMIGVTTRGAERLERLVMNLLAVSQIESGTMPIFPDEVSLGDLVREKVDAMLKEHDRAVVSISESSLVVRADRERIGHAVEHLIENAVKFGGPHGEIRIMVDRDNGFGRVSISDEGPGVPLADQERIFERFTRLGDVLTRETQGAGVGLFIAARSVEAMGGQIWVESEGGHGSTFHLTVPLARPMAVEDQADTA